MITFIVSVFDRPWFLNACLASLAVNPDPKQVIVCDNSTDPAMQAHIETVCQRYSAVHASTAKCCKECYDSANLVVSRQDISAIDGEWLCFPSDDSLYVCGFTEIMLTAAREYQADVVLCDSVYRKPGLGWAPYSLLHAEPKMGRIDKTCFIVKREMFKGFPEHPKGWRDGALIDQLVREGRKIAKAPGYLVVHQ